MYIKKRFVGMVIFVVLVLAACSGNFNKNTEQGTSSMKEPEISSTEIMSESSTETLTEMPEETATEISTETESPTESEVESETEPETETEVPTEPPHEHSYIESIIKEAGCTEGGEKTFSCECGDFYTEVIAPIGHVFGVYVPNNDATYTADGTETATCICGLEDTRTIKGSKLEYTYTELNKVMYAKSVVNVRNLPSTAGKKLGALSEGQEVVVTGQCNETGWYRIEFKGNTAYVSSKYLVNEKPRPAVVATADEMFNTFSVQDLDGKTYTQDVFAEAEVNVVILSTSWCGYCHKELPALERVMKAYSGKSVQFFNIVCDSGYTNEQWKQIYSSITFPSLLYNESIVDGYIASNNSYPKILYLDNEGNLLYEIKGSAAGTYGEDYAVNLHSTLINKYLGE